MYIYIVVGGYNNIFSFNTFNTQDPFSFSHVIMQIHKGTEDNSFS